MINLGLLIYALGWTVFLLPYTITTGGVTGISAIIYYATDVPIQVSYAIINLALLGFAFKFIGKDFCIKTLYATVVLALYLWLFQEMMKNADGTFTQVIGPGQDSMACILGAVMCGIGLGTVFLNNGSTGGTDIIAAVINKYRNITIGRTIMYCDIIIISSCYFVFHDWRRVVFGFVVLFILSYTLDMVLNSARQSVQFFIISKKYDEISERICKDMHRGVTLLDGTGWYSKTPVKTMVVMARKNQSVRIFRLVKDIDPQAFVTQSNVVGVYGEGFDQIR